MTNWSAISEHISEATGSPFQMRAERSVGGGCINTANVIQDGQRKYFIKLNDADRRDMFTAEAEGLEALAKANAVRVPQPVCWGTTGRSAYLVLEYLDLTGGDRKGPELFGRHLAQMHRTTHAEHGWHRNNTIGSTPQVNTSTSNWTEFWRRHRLGYQLKLAAHRGYGGRLQQRGELLLLEIETLFRGYTPAASLLHGDLWSGNYAFDSAGTPVIFDPAVYYGDRETDLAMTELFGGFSGRFYDAYRESYPLEPGYNTRKTLYNLYHILNHLNLFGGGYRSQAEHMIDSLLSEIH
jgi:fructosamine-3-kinase